MLSRFFRRRPQLEFPQFDPDPALNDLQLRQARDGALAGDWQAAARAIEDAGTNGELRCRRISVLSEAAVKEDAWLYKWLAEHPHDAAAVTIQAAMLSERAGNERGGASAAQTSDAQFRAFADLSAAAAEVSRRAMSLAGPSDPAPWVEFMGTMFGDRQARRSFAATYEEGRRRDPYNFELHLTAVGLLCQKWGGSHERMFDAARGAAAAAPPGANAVMLPFLAHFEYALREFGWDQWDRETLIARHQYLERPDVRQELDSWAAKWRAGQHTVGREMTCRHWLALYYTATGRHREAKVVFDEIGVYLGSPTAWGYFYGVSARGFVAGWKVANDAG
ncbi:hypothetical protein AB0F81_15945 [Actinoplanes sp. NPDC024001]|uniref:hypothetical protein n=1 Tax=Actinoplanes sp. NPDC024001 TaxID=3154598 RepID=UPI0033F51AB0